MKIESLQYAKESLRKSIQNIDEALVHVKDATDLGFMDKYQIQEFSRKAKDFLGAARDGIAVELLDK